MIGRLLDKIAYRLIALGKRRCMFLRLDTDATDGVSVRYRKGADPRVSITWESGTHRERVGLVLTRELAHFVAQGLREALIEIEGVGENTAFSPSPADSDSKE